MTSKTTKPASADGSTIEVPGAAADVAREHPELWQALQVLGDQVTHAGPLDARTCRLVHLAFAIAGGSEGATHSHARRAVAEGIDARELEHVALLAITTLGWPQAIRGLTWVRDIAHGKKQ